MRNKFLTRLTSFWPICLPKTDLCLHGGGFTLSVEQNPIDFAKIHENLKREADSGSLRRSNKKKKKVVDQCCYAAPKSKSLNM